MERILYPIRSVALETVFYYCSEKYKKSGGDAGN